MLFFFFSPGLLGIGAGDSSDDDDDDDDNSNTDGNTDGKPAAGAGAAAAAPTVPEGLPADFFDNADDVESPSPSEVTAGVEALEGGKERSVTEATPTAEFGAERAAVLAAEAAVVAEADARREAEKLAAMRAAGVVVPTLDEAAAAAGEGGAVGMDGRAGAGAAAPVANGDAAEAAPAPNGSALPEGFFDDPEIDAKSRGVDLKAKKKEDEQ